MSDAEAEADGKALVVFEQEEIDVIIHALENYGYGEEQFQQEFGEIYEKLMAIRADSGSEYRLR